MHANDIIVNVDLIFAVIYQCKRFTRVVFGCWRVPPCLRALKLPAKGHLGNSHLSPRRLRYLRVYFFSLTTLLRGQNDLHLGQEKL